jgi:hypothetical protein
MASWSRTPGQFCSLVLNTSAPSSPALVVHAGRQHHRAHSLGAAADRDGQRFALAVAQVGQRHAAHREALRGRRRAVVQCGVQCAAGRLLAVAPGGAELPQARFELAFAALLRHQFGAQFGFQRAQLGGALFEEVDRLLGARNIALLYRAGIAGHAPYRRRGIGCARARVRVAAASGGSCLLAMLGAADVVAADRRLGGGAGGWALRDFHIRWRRTGIVC